MGSDDYLRFASVVNKNCDDFKPGELSAVWYSHKA